MTESKWRLGGHCLWWWGDGNIVWTKKDHYGRGPPFVDLEWANRPSSCRWTSATTTLLPWISPPVGPPMLFFSGDRLCLSKRNTCSPEHTLVSFHLFSLPTVINRPDIKMVGTNIFLYHSRRSCCSKINKQGWLTSRKWAANYWKLWLRRYEIYRRKTDERY